MKSDWKPIGYTPAEKLRSAVAWAALAFGVLNAVLGAMTLLGYE